jgi:putative transposase
MTSKQYTSDLTNIEFQQLLIFLPVKVTKSLKYSYHQILNGIFYTLKNGCTWRDIPSNLPPWQTCYYHFDKLCKLRLWERIKLELNKKVRRIVESKEELPSCLLLDSQSVKNTDTGCKSGIDGNKKIKGIKRHLLCDTIGLNWNRCITSANKGDREGALLLSQMSQVGNCKEILLRCSIVKVDQGYLGEEFAIDFYMNCKVLVEVVEKLPNQKGFQVLPMRWIIERSNAWMDKCRRLWKNCERKIETAESMIDICFIRINLKKLFGD